MQAYAVPTQKHREGCPSQGNVPAVTPGRQPRQVVNPDVRFSIAAHGSPLSFLPASPQARASLQRGSCQAVCRGAHMRYCTATGEVQQDRDR